MKMGVNYGYEKIRFPAPVRVGSKLRLGVTLASVTEVPGGLQIALNFVWEVEGGVKPACVAEMLLRYSALASRPDGASFLTGQTVALDLRAEAAVIGFADRSFPS
jgi:hypothetical protein